jgi:hypothetical protein
MTGTSQEASVVDRYLRFWNSTSAGQWQQLASETFTDDVEYVAPIGVLIGSKALVDFGVQFSDHVGSFEFRARDEVQTHHDRARLRWEILTGNDTSLATGTDVIVISEDARVRSVTTFLERAPEGFDPNAHHQE